MQALRCKHCGRPLEAMHEPELGLCQFCRRATHRMHRFTRLSAVVGTVEMREPARERLASSLGER